MSSSGYVFYFKACTIPTKLCLGLSPKFSPISGVVSLLNRTIFSTAHMTIFLPHTKSGTITFGLSFDTNSWELLYLTTVSNEHDTVNVLPPHTIIQQSVKFYFHFVLKSQTLHVPPYLGGGGRVWREHNVGSTEKRSKYKKCIGYVPRTIKVVIVLRNRVLFVTNECLSIHIVYTWYNVLNYISTRGLKSGN
jgi:hypothetical protein